MQLSRRDVLKLGVLGSAALALPLERVARTQLAASGRLPATLLPQLQFVLPFQTPPVLTPVPKTIKIHDGTTYVKSVVVDYYDIHQRAVNQQVLPKVTKTGAPTNLPKTTLWMYDGAPKTGSPKLGGTIVVDAGQEVVVKQSNRLPDHPTLLYKPATSTHLHGSASLPQFDGYASDIVRQGESKYYQYPDFQKARTLWYHDHGVHQTARNAYMGLAAQYHLHDPFEKANLPQGEFDVPVTIRDAIFGTNGQLIYADNDSSSLMGDVILVNGVPWPRMKVKRRTYRFRFLNASLSRSYRLQLDTKQDMLVVGGDGGLLPVPQRVKDFRFSPAERYEVVIDFSQYGPGQQIVLKDLGLKNNVRYPSTANVMMFQVVGDTPDMTNSVIPGTLQSDHTMDLTESMSEATRRLVVKRQGGEWTINDHTWEDVVRSGYREVIGGEPKLGAVEVWELVNESGGWFHPVHIHLIDFKILDRTVNKLVTQPPFPYELGAKDVAYVGENESVRVIAHFGPHPGKYMIHCHNLVHEDHDMMVQFRVRAQNGEVEHDPRLAAMAEDSNAIAPVEEYPYFRLDVPGTV